MMASDVRIGEELCPRRVSSRAGVERTGLRALSVFLFTVVVVSSSARGHAATLEVDEARVELGEEWLVADAGTLPQHRALEGFVGAAFLDEGIPAVAVLTFSKWSPELPAIRGSEALEKHLERSREAIATVPSAQLVRAEVLAGSEVALVETLRRDVGLLEELGILEKETEVRQLTFVVPTSGGLAQLFVYLPPHDKVLRDQLVDRLPDAIEATRPPKEEPDRQWLFMLGAVVFGLALICILGLRGYFAWRRRSARGRAGPEVVPRAPGEETPKAPWEHELDASTDATPGPDQS